MEQRETTAQGGNLSRSQGADLARLPKLLARLDSDQDAEVLAAARAASRLLRVAGLGWDDVVSGAPAKGWRGMLDIGKKLAAETRRRVAAERAAHHWQTLARLRDAAATPRPVPEPVAAPAAEAPVSTIVEAPSGHALIDALLACPALDAAERLRVDAIASWYRRSGDLLDAENRDLTAIGRRAGLLTEPARPRVAA